ncbi:MAG: toxin-antitoxin system YwqK family antitoxin [Parachlamydiales bacterium]
MRVCLLLLLCFACTRLPPEQQLTSVSIIDQNGMSQTVQSKERLSRYARVNFEAGGPYQKVLRVYGRDGEGHVRSRITGYHPNGQPRQALEVVDGRAFGSYKEWHTNGQLKLVAVVVGGSADIDDQSVASYLFDGVSRAWDEGGNLLAEIPYWKGELHGLSTYYYPSGKVWKEIPFYGGKRTGTSREYGESGDLLAYGEWEGDLPTGKALQYYTKDRLASYEEYEEGRLMLGEYYNREGRLIASVKEGEGIRGVAKAGGLLQREEIRGGYQEGRVEIEDAKGRLLRAYHLSHGIKNGEEVEFYPETGKPKLALTWREGQIVGIAKTWYPSGHMESKREISNSRVNGVAMAWYEDGNLMLIEEYVEGRLLKGEYFPKGTPSAISRVMNGRGMATLYDGEGNYLRKVNYAEGIPVES